MPRLTPPTNTTFFVSLFFFVLAVLGHAVPQVAAAVPFSASWWAPVAAYIVLAIGVLVRGV
jgi:hypothetical protein